MNLPRRDFLKTTLAASATVALGSPALAAGTKESTGREYYELRCYRLKADTRLKADANPALLDVYLERALLPALGQLGINHTGVFTELDVNKETETAAPKANSPVWVLIPHPSLDSFVRVSATLNADPAVQAAGAAYLQAPKASPAFERIDTWLLLAFAGMPKLELPAFCHDRVPTRVFEMRDYESHSEPKALSKMAMFDDGEIQLMRDLGMNPVFFGQALAGPNLPHLRYFTSGPDLTTHLAGWKKFGPDPRWTKMKNDPRYADNTSLNTARFLTPKSYSQI
ncbi:MAG TPA: NIPSNAP family protein [Lacunisphaera sp.]